MGIRNTRNPNAMLGLEIGDRIKLKRMPDDPDPIPVNTLGTVTGFFEDPDCGQVWVDWDNGRNLALCVGVDRWEKVSNHD